MERPPEAFRSAGDEVTLKTNGPWSDSDLQVMLCLVIQFGYPTNLDNVLQPALQASSFSSNSSR